MEEGGREGKGITASFRHPGTQAMMGEEGIGGREKGKIIEERKLKKEGKCKKKNSSSRRREKGWKL